MTIGKHMLLDIEGSSFLLLRLFFELVQLDAWDNEYLHQEPNCDSTNSAESRKLLLINENKKLAGISLVYLIGIVGVVVEGRYAIVENGQCENIISILICMLPKPQIEDEEITEKSIQQIPQDYDKRCTSYEASKHPLFFYNVLKTLKLFLGLFSQSSEMKENYYKPCDCVELVERLVCMLSNSKRYKPRAVQMAAILLLEVVRTPSQSNNEMKILSKIAMFRCRQLKGIRLLTNMTDDKLKLQNQFPSTRYKSYVNQDINLKRYSSRADN